MLIREVERFLTRHNIPPTRFGMLAASDPRLVFDLRNGREPRKRMRVKVEHFMNTYREDRHEG